MFLICTIKDQEIYLNVQGYEEKGDNILNLKGHLMIERKDYFTSPLKSSQLGIYQGRINTKKTIQVKNITLDQCQLAFKFHIGAQILAIPLSNTKKFM